MNFIRIIIIFFLTQSFKAQSQPRFAYEFGIKSGVATIYNSSITNVGYIHDYRVGAAHATNILLRKKWKKNVLSLGTQLQFTSVKYMNYSKPSYPGEPNLPETFINYRNRMYELQLIFGFHRNLAPGFEIGILLTPTFIIASYENYKWQAQGNLYQRFNETTKNNPAYNRFVLLGSLELAKVQTLKSGKTLRYTFSPTISLSNPGGVNSYGVAMSPKGNFSSFYVNAQGGIAYQFR